MCCPASLKALTLSVGSASSLAAPGMAFLISVVQLSAPRATIVPHCNKYGQPIKQFGNIWGFLSVTGELYAC